MIRFIIAILFVVLFLILTIPIALLILIIGLFNPALKDRISLGMVKWAFSVALFIAGTSVTVIGEDNIPKDRAVLYVGNHRSYFDILVTCARFNRPTGFVAKKELGRVPLLSMWMRFIHCHFLDRKDMKQGLATILNCAKDIQSGISIFIFPEGTRNTGEEGSLLPFHEGSLKIAEKSHSAVLPVAISNSQAIFERQFPCLKKSHVILEYCAPIETEGLSREEKRGLALRVQGIIQEKLTEHKNLL